MFFVYIKQTLKNFKKIISTFFELLGAILLVYELLNIYYKEVIENINFSTHGLIFLLLSILFLSIITNIPKLKKTFKIKNRDISITIVVGNIFRQKGSIVIPTNTTFDTLMENDFISLKSIQGQFQQKYFKDNLKKLDILIKNGLSNVKISEKLNDNRKTKTNRYECGTVSKIMVKDKKIYFLALADVSDNGTPNANYYNIIKSLQGLWDFLSRNKHIEELIIPIIGTGRAGIVDATRMQVIKDIILSFATMSNEIKITNNLVVCIHPNDIKMNKIDINEIFEYVEYTSKYKFEQIDSKIKGKPLE